MLSVCKPIRDNLYIAPLAGGTPELTSSLRLASGSLAGEITIQGASLHVYRACKSQQCPVVADHCRSLFASLRPMQLRKGYVDRAFNVHMVYRLAPYSYSRVYIGRVIGSTYNIYVYIRCIVYPRVHGGLTV